MPAHDEPPLLQEESLLQSRALPRLEASLPSAVENSFELAPRTGYRSGEMPGDTRSSSSNYEVGYKKPPRTGCFKKGQRANPKGRPKGSKNARQIVLEEADMKVTVREGGRTRKMSKFQIGVRKAMNSFAEKGDLKLLIQLLKLLDSTSAADRKGVHQEPEPLTSHEVMMEELWDLVKDTWNEHGLN